MKNILKDYHVIVLADADGTITDTNVVKDIDLGNFCRKEFNSDLGDDAYNHIHHEMHGKPMAEIFVEIAKRLHGTDISFDKGQEITDRLNEFIKPTYFSRPVYEGAKEFYAELKNDGATLYILTGMETDIVSQNFDKKEMSHMFKGVYGAPKNKAENIKEILKKENISNKPVLIIGIGDAMTEMRAVNVYSNSVFVGCDFENRTKRVFPENVQVITDYKNMKQAILKEIAMKQLCSKTAEQSNLNNQQVLNYKVNQASQNQKV